MLGVNLVSIYDILVTCENDILPYTQKLLQTSSFTISTSTGIKSPHEKIDYENLEEKKRIILFPTKISELNVKRNLIFYFSKQYSMHTLGRHATGRPISLDFP